jgi:hypothetical protein
VRRLFSLIFSFSMGALCAASPDAAWNANTGLKSPRELTDHELGNAQGATLIGGRVYVYGDKNRSEPRIGVIKEYDTNLQPTGRLLQLARNGEPLIIHPTGLTQDPDFGTILGDTMKGVSTFYRLDWELAWREGNLDNAVQDIIRDDAAVNGGRPIFVQLHGRTLLATSDYGPSGNQLRLYDPGALLREKHSLAPGVMVHAIPAGPFTQNLTWDAKTQNLTFVQNVAAGRGWQLDTVHLPAAISAGGVDAPGVRFNKRVFLRHDELEGVVELPSGEELFILGGHEHSMAVGRSHPIETVHSPVGDLRYGRDPEPVAKSLCASAYGRLARPQLDLAGVGQ